MTDETATPTATDRLHLADWRRRVAELYAEVRATAATDPAAARATWAAEREALYRDHPSSPVLPSERATFRARHWPYDDRLRFEVAVEPAAAGVRARRPRRSRPPQQRRRRRSPSTGSAR